MIVITCSSGMEVEGLRLAEDLESDLFGQMPDEEKVSNLCDVVRTHLTLKRAFDEGEDLVAAARHVWSRTPKVD